MKITVIRKPTTKEKLETVYDVLNKVIKDPKCFYTSSEVKQLKKDSTTIWL